MTNPVVTNVVQDSTGAPIKNAVVTILLVGAPGFNGNTEIVAQTTVTADATGTWSAAHVPNALISPANTYYKAIEQGGGSWTYVVPNGAGPYPLNTILTVNPTAPSASLGVVRYDADQTGVLTSGQQALALANIAAVGVSQKGAANGVATLDSGSKIPASQIPAMAIDQTYVVSSQAAMLALAANPGDLCKRTDLNPLETFILQAAPASTLANWVQITSSGAVTSVAGRAGDVTLTTADLGDLPATYVPYATLAKVPDLIITGAITRDANEVCTSAAVVWPDGTTGTFTATSIGTLNTIDAYTITRIIGGTTHTYTQPTITRDASGSATNVPAMTYV